MKRKVKVVLNNGAQPQLSISNLSEIETQLKQMGYNPELIRTVHFLGV
ncbi:hypothetical protein [Paenibacillus xylanexedens]|nr:hypothetical protein [Paenibacillus xylanexedens]RPK20128.1 hypothetical protein EDO6_06667 [Paenibacillus xylanexedens]